MRTLVMSGVLLVATLAQRSDAAPPSNPAFLGITMQGGRPPSTADCFVEAVTMGGGAEAAGMRATDRIIALEGVRIASCDEVTAIVTSHVPGDVVALDVVRAGVRMTMHATLSTRAEIVRRRVVGKPLAPVDVTDLEDGRDYRLSELRGTTTIVAFADVSACVACGALIRRVSDAITPRRRELAAPRLVVVTPGSVEALAAAKINIGVPIAVASPDILSTMAIGDNDRVEFMILDSRGVVRFVTPAAPDSDDEDAVVDEVLAAAEQAEHARRR